MALAPLRMSRRKRFVVCIAQKTLYSNKFVKFEDFQFKSGMDSLLSSCRTRACGHDYLLLQRLQPASSRGLDWPFTSLAFWFLALHVRRLRTAFPCSSAWVPIVFFALQCAVKYLLWRRDSVRSFSCSYWFMYNEQIRKCSRATLAPLLKEDLSTPIVSLYIKLYGHKLKNAQVFTYLMRLYSKNLNKHVSF